MAYFACKSNWTGTLLTHTARIFRLFDPRLTCDRSRKHRRDTGKFSYRTSAIHIDPAFLFFSTLDIFCVRKYFGKYLYSCSPKTLRPKTELRSSSFEDFNCDSDSELLLKFNASEIFGHISRNFIVLNTIQSHRLLCRLN